MSLINHSTFPALDRFQHFRHQKNPDYNQMGSGISCSRLVVARGEVALPRETTGALGGLEFHLHSCFRINFIFFILFYLNLTRKNLNLLGIPHPQSHLSN